MPISKTQKQQLVILSITPAIPPIIAPQVLPQVPRAASTSVLPQIAAPPVPSQVLPPVPSLQVQLPAPMGHRAESTVPQAQPPAPVEPRAESVLVRTLNRARPGFGFCAGISVFLFCLYL